MVCPTCVGMNRRRFTKRSRPGRMPHVRGDEPKTGEFFLYGEGVCPTCVGMNRVQQTNRPDG